MKTFRFAVLLLPFLLAGCVTDKLVVFEKSLLSEEEMKPFFGKWKLIEANDFAGKNRDYESGNLTMEQKALRYQFSLETTDKAGKRVVVAGNFLLSKIPDSKSSLLLFSSPKSNDGDKDYSNGFGIMKQDKNAMYFWFVTDKMPVAEGCLSKVEGGGYTADSVKSFLEKYADTFIRANAPQYTFEKKQQGLSAN